MVRMLMQDGSGIRYRNSEMVIIGVALMGLLYSLTEWLTNGIKFVGVEGMQKRRIGNLKLPILLGYALETYGLQVKNKSTDKAFLSAINHNHSSAGILNLSTEQIITPSINCISVYGLNPCIGIFIDRNCRKYMIIYRNT